MTDFSSDDCRYMARALQLARRGWYTAHPNPVVGCVIARRGRIVGEGYHHRAGLPHAEVNALERAGDQATGGIAYITLEPCNHQGRTGPCAQALIQAGVAEVVYGMKDPHLAAGGGLDTLRAAGVSIRGPLMAEAASDLNRGFIKRCQTGLPYVTAKLAMSLDGRTAMASGESQWITGEPARRDGHCLRARSGAVITGVGSVLKDNPSMTVREAMLPLEHAEEIASRQPLRVIVDSHLRTPSKAAMFDLPGEILIATAVDKAPDGLPTNVSCRSFPGKEGRVDLEALLTYLGRLECNDVLVEAGPELVGAFMSAGLIDRLVIYMAAKLMGSEAQPLMALPLEHLSQNIALHIEDIRALGKDWRIIATVEEKVKNVYRNH